MVPLALQLGDHDDGEDHLVLGEPEQRAGVGQQDGGVEHVGAELRLEPLLPDWRAVLLV